MPDVPGFIAKHHLWSAAQTEAAAQVAAAVGERKLRTIRVSVADPQGKLRSKTVLPGMFRSVMKNGLDFTSAQFNFDSAEGIAYNPFTEDGGVGLSEMAGFPDVILVPDPLTFQVLPWAEDCGWIQGDMYFNDGRPVPFDARHILKKTTAELKAAGFDYVAGLEVEFYVTRVTQHHLAPHDLGNLGIPPTPPSVEAIGRGYAYQSEEHQDQIDGLLNVLARHCEALGLPLRTMEDEMGPGQLEFTFEPQSALAAADTMTLFRSMVKQVTARMGLHATFMARPGLDNFCASGWHLHQSVTDADGNNAFAAPAHAATLLSPLGEHFVGGLLAHAVEASVFCTPTVNGYKRRKPNSLAPDRVTWGYDNRAAMCRVQGGPGDPSSHVENRIGEPAANPYLYLACQIAAGLDGIRNAIGPGPLEASPYTAVDRPLLPKTLMDAMRHLRDGTFYRRAFGDQFIDWYLGLKQNEVNRFLAAEPDWADDPDRVTDWEHREYFTRY
ncbi:glutamine synthetase family protein [Robbsia sp. Bb-Pol-6]|uniref:Glutamine synthetase family protein n=1 Tax=Robbsia betulipollinis TaxID=2981849 RepID=A0ABT3ZHA9_9BURK|nr:glutamine synthetase family protein [Robbsia betulipollinis]MCY0385916.1 glutamine synthetase family protein [Robbsia betulipollinis]